MPCGPEPESHCRHSGRILPHRPDPGVQRAAAAGAEAAGEHPAGLSGPLGGGADLRPHRHHLGPEPLERPGHRRPGPAGVRAAAVGPVGAIGYIRRLS